MSNPDLNLLLTLDALLAEGSVAGAARRLRLSPSAMSRSLARLREATGDPLLVRAGRGLVASPRALELRERIAPLVQEAQAALRPAAALRLDTLEREFTLRTREGFVENFGAALLARVAGEAPAVRLRFVPKTDRDSGPLRDGSVDLETGVIGATTGPELRAQALFGDRFVGVVREGHALSRGRVTVARFAAGQHIAISRGGTATGPVDDALTALALRRDAAVTVTGFGQALALVRGSDLIATVPERHTGTLRDGLVTFALPLPLAPFTVSLLWHPRMDGDAAHRWLRGCVRESCA
ncbi:LysR family transcriptional regulator [Roseateles sp. DXS20W]|uniref:LysR family transcriptional regulator n=1 Tax=Pelomonas lactea TaxID=3299030 RepID=A0ABW7GHB2_9BURK